MPNCTSIDPLVTPYVDGELSGGRSPRVDDHLRACPPCHSRVARRTRGARSDARRSERADAWSAALAQAAPLRGLAAPERPRLPASPAAAPATSPRVRRAARSWLPPWRGLAPLALAASLVLRRRRRVRLSGDAPVVARAGRRADRRSREVLRDQQCRSARTMARGRRKLDGSGFGWQHAPAEDSPRAGLELVGARPCLYGEGNVAHIMYRAQRAAGVAVHAAESTRARRAGRGARARGGHLVVGNRTFVLVAREPRAEVERMASFVKAALH